MKLKKVFDGKCCCQESKYGYEEQETITLFIEVNDIDLGLCLECWKKVIAMVEILRDSTIERLEVN